MLGIFGLLENWRLLHPLQTSYLICKDLELVPDLFAIGNNALRKSARGTDPRSLSFGLRPH